MDQLRTAGAIDQTAKRPRPWAILTVSVGTLFFVGTGGTAINPALQPIGESLGMGASMLSLTVGIYMVTVASLVAPGGKLGDILGGRNVVLAGLLLFAVSAALAATATTAWPLVASRALRGAGSALLLPATVGMLRLGYPPTRQGLALGVWGAVAVLSLAIGPLVGGAITDGLSWRWLSWISLGVCVVIALGAWRPLGRLPRPPRGRRLDVGGAVVATAALSAVILLVTQSRRWGYASIPTACTFVVAAVSVVLLIGAERRAKEPVLDPALLRSPHLLAGVVAGIVNAGATLGILYFFNLFVQSGYTFGYSPLSASVAVLPFAVSSFVTSILAGALYDRYGYGWPVLVGLALTGFGVVGLGISAASHSYAPIVGPLVIAGIGVGMTAGAPFAIALRAVGPSRAGEVSGLLNAFRYGSAALVIGLGTAVFDEVGEARLNAALRRAGAPPASIEQLDSVLSATVSRIAEAERNLGLSTADMSFRTTALHGVVAGYSATMLILGAEALLAAAAWPVLIRRATRPVLGY